MELGLQGKVAVICGSSKGLGFAVANGLAREGAQVVLTARNAENLNRAAQAISQGNGTDVLIVPSDLTRPEQANGVIKVALNTHGRVDILVNNAGAPRQGQFSDFEINDWESAYKLNFLSAVAMTKNVIPGMKQLGFGRIINLTSITVKQPLDNLILSNSVRSAVHGWAKSLANELAPYGITVNNVMPGYILTDRVRRLAEDMAAEEGISTETIMTQLIEDIPMGRLGRPEELADLVIFLASERAAYITGASIAIDGGFSKCLL